MSFLRISFALALIFCLFFAPGSGVQPSAAKEVWYSAVCNHTRYMVASVSGSGSITFKAVYTMQYSGRPPIIFPQLRYENRTINFGGGMSREIWFYVAPTPSYYTWSSGMYINGNFIYASVRCA